MCTKKLQSLAPALCPAQRFNCLYSTSSLMQCSCIALHQTAGKSAIWERVVRSLILSLCLRATFKWGLPTWTSQRYIAGKLAYGRLGFLALPQTLFIIMGFGSRSAVDWLWLTSPDLLCCFGSGTGITSAPEWVKSQPCTCCQSQHTFLTEQPTPAASWPEKNGVYDFYFP